MKKSLKQKQSKSARYAYKSLEISKVGELESKIRKHLGMFLLLLGILLFLGSLLGLANTVIWPEESLPYRLGNLLVLVSIVIIITGCIIGVRGLLRRGREKKEVGGARRVCRECGKELKGYPEDVDICSRCRKRIEERKREILFSGKIRLVRILLGVMILLFAILSVIVSLRFIILLLSLIVSIYLIKSRKSRLFSEAILTGLSITAFTGFSIIPFVPASPALFFKRFLPIRALGELFLIGPYVISTLTLTGTIFVFTVSLMKRAKRIGPKTSHIIVLVSTLLPFIIVTLAPTQPSPGPMISASMSGGARGNWLTWDSFPPGF